MVTHVRSSLALIYFKVICSKSNFSHEGWVPHVRPTRRPITDVRVSSTITRLRDNFPLSTGSHRHTKAIVSIVERGRESFNLSPDFYPAWLQQSQHQHPLFTPISLTKVENNISFHIGLTVYAIYACDFRKFNSITLILLPSAERIFICCLNFSVFILFLFLNLLLILYVEPGEKKKLNGHLFCLIALEAKFNIEES